MVRSLLFSIIVTIREHHYLGLIHFIINGSGAGIQAKVFTLVWQIQLSFFLYMSQVPFLFWTDNNKQDNFFL